MITKCAMELLKEKKYEELESELNRIEESYRFCNKVREASEETAKIFLEEKQKLILQVIQLEKDKAQILKTKTDTNKIMQAVLTDANIQAQLRMQEIEQLKTQIREFKRTE